ncbi:heparan-alpha-glucosaminide N-acetyltransferase domain-containing protein [Salinifilum aidingensis]
MSAPQEAAARDGSSPASDGSRTPPQDPPPANGSSSGESSGTGGKAKSAAGSAARLVGIDFARAIAILGMFASHVGPTDYDHPHSWAFLPFHGRAAILFAVLAGISIAIMSGSREPAVGRSWRKALVRIGTRAVLMLALGLVMNQVFIVPVWIILAYYGGFFLLSLPFLRMRAGSLGLLAAFMIAFAPVVSWWIRSAYFPKTLMDTPLNDLDFAMLTSLSGIGEFAVTLMLTGVFPTFIWIGYVLAGMALGRLDLTSLAVARRLTFGGAALAAVAYVSSWLTLYAFGGINRIYATIQSYADADGVAVNDFLHLNLFRIQGTPPTDTPAWLLLPYAHVGTPFNGAAGVGLSLLVIGGCMWLQPYTARFMKPFAAVGAISLTCYVGHLVVMQLLWGGEPNSTATNALLFLAGSVLFAVLWQRWYGQGPLEKFVAKISSRATRSVP